MPYSGCALLAKIFTTQSILVRLVRIGIFIHYNHYNITTKTFFFGKVRGRTKKGEKKCAEEGGKWWIIWAARGHPNTMHIFLAAMDGTNIFPYNLFFPSTLGRARHQQQQQGQQGARHLGGGCGQSREPFVTRRTLVVRSLSELGGRGGGARSNDSSGPHTSSRGTRMHAVLALNHVVKGA